MTDRASVHAARVLLVLVVSAVCFGVTFGQGQRKEVAGKTAIRNVDPGGLFSVVAPGVSFIYRVSLKQGRQFNVGNGDGIVVTASSGNIVVGASRRISNTIYELDFSSADNNLGGSATLQINLTNQKGRLKFVRGAVTIAPARGNQLVTIADFDKTIISRVDVGTRPIGIDTSGPGGQFADSAFVCNAGSNSVSVVDQPTGTVEATIPVGAQPSYVALAGATTVQLGYVTNTGGNSVTVFDAQTLEVLKTIPVGRAPIGVAVSGIPSINERVYVANRDDDTVSVIDPVTNTVVQTIAVGDGPTGVAVNGPINLQVVCVTNANAGTVSLIAVETNTVIATVNVGSQPVAVAGGGVTLNLFYVANQGAGTVSFVDINSQTETARVLVGGQPNGLVAVGPSAREQVYVSNSDGTVAVIDSAQETVRFTVPVGGRPRGIAVDGPVTLANVLVTN